jgi:hypothetical protein
MWRRDREIEIVGTAVFLIGRAFGAKGQNLAKLISLFPGYSNDEELTPDLEDDVEPR